MNLIGPAATVDAGLLEAFQDLEDRTLLLLLLLGLLSDLSHLGMRHPAPFDQILHRRSAGQGTDEPPLSFLRSQKIVELRVKP